MSNNSDNKLQDAAPEVSTPGDAEPGDPVPSTLKRRSETPDPCLSSPGLDSAPLVICEPETVATTSVECGSEPPPDAEYVCIPSSDGEYHLEEVQPTVPDDREERNVAPLADPTPMDAAVAPAEASGEGATSAGLRRKRPREERKGKKKCKKPRFTQVQEPYETDLDRFLEDTAEKNNLTVTNVKNIIRRVVSNTRVLAMLQNTMLSHVAAEETGSDLSSLPYEPKFTRAKAREIMEKQPHLLWQVSPMKLSAPSGSQQLLQQEFPDESSSDEEYHPASEESEDETEPPSSVATTVPPSPPASDAALESPEKQEPSDAAAASSADAEKESGIAERTRSKLPLRDTPLECIEAQFIAPDITTDMYDTECDDEEWKEFLFSLIKPFEQEDNHEDDVEDPEYTIQEEEDENDDSWDIRNDQAVKIPQKEVNELMTELMQVATRELLDNEEEDEAPLGQINRLTPAKGSTSIATIGSADQSEAEIFLEATESVQDEILAQPTPRQIQQLEEQMRMHVQLLAQMCVLCSNSEHLTSNFEMAQTLLRELARFASRPMSPPERQSLFMACNLRPAVQMLDSMPHRGSGGTPVKMSTRVLRRNRLKNQVPSHARDILLDSPVFMYPHLLPLSRMYSPLHDPLKKVIFFPSEDHLLALGLEQFVPPRCCSFSTAYLRLIRTFLLPVKTEIQIKVHVKNIIYKKVGEENAVKYWHVHKVAPPLVWEPNPIDAQNMLPPCKRPPNKLPLWMQMHLSSRPSRPARRSAAAPGGMPTTPPRIQPAASPLSGTTVVCPSSSLLTIGGTVVVSPPVISAPVTLTLSPAPAPRHTLVSPLKHISPILKKYSQYGRKILLKMPVKKRLSYDKEPSTSAAAAPKEERENQFTQQYLNRVQEALKDDDSRQTKFMCLLNNAMSDKLSPVQLFRGIEELLYDHQDLVDEFVGFLLPEQALQCGKLPQYLTFSKIHLFLRKLEIHFGQQPQQLQRLMRSLTQLHRQPQLNADAIFSVLQPLVRGHSHLMEELQQLLPNQGVPESLMDDFEEVTLPDEEEEEEEEENGAGGSPGGAGSSCEELTLSPPRDTPGTSQCPCTCHQRSSDPRFLSRVRHCTRCGIKCSKSKTGRDGDKPSSKEGQAIIWTRQDDKMLLQSCQQYGSEKGIQRTSQALGRPPEQVTSRFQELIRLFEASKSDDEVDS
ncbi:gon-4 like protein muscle wasted isoform X4 [Amblyomma americanum]